MTYEIPNPADIEKGLRAFVAPGQVTELRAFGVDGRSNTTHSGYYNNIQKLAMDAAGLNAAGIYIIPNPIHLDLLSRRNNRVDVAEKGCSTSDEHIMLRNWLHVDIDPIRVSGISATETEHNAALAKADEVKSVLRSEGWSDPIVMDTGNGASLFYTIHLVPAGDLVERVLKRLDLRFSDDRVKIDTATHNPARLCRVPETMNRKGDSTPERPHRRARLLEVPTTRKPIPRELLEQTACGHLLTDRNAHANIQASKIDITDLLRRNGVAFDGPDPWNAGQKWVLHECPWNTQHTNKSAFIGQFGNGAVVARCHHNSCKEYGWQDLRVKLGIPKVEIIPAATPTLKDLCLPYKPFPMGVLPDPVRAYVENGIESIGCPDSFVAAPVLSVLAAAIGNSQQLLIKDGYTEPALLWTVIVGDSGQAKTPALNHAIRPLLKIEKANHERYVAELNEFRRLYKDWKLKSSRTARTQQGGCTDEPECPELKRIMCNDATMESILGLLHQNPNGLLDFHDELAGFFHSFDAYRKGRGGDAEHWLEIWNAKAVSVDRKSPEQPHIWIPNANVSITGGMQPKVLDHIMTERFLENGMAARFLITQPPPTAGDFSDVPIDESRAKAMEDLVYALVSRRPIAGTQCDPVLIHLSPHAKQLYVEVFNRMKAEMRDLNGALQAAWAKMICYLGRFALILHCVKAEAPGTIPLGHTLTEQTMQDAVTLIQWFCHETRRVYSQFSKNTADLRIGTLVEKIRQLGSDVSPRDLQRSDGRLKTSEAATDALDELVRLGLGEWFHPAPKSQAGRPPDRRFRLKSMPPDTTD